MDRETGEGRMGGCALLLLLVSTLLVQIRASDPLLYKPFVDETFEGRWSSLARTTTKRGAALDIYVSKVVRVNGKALDKAAKVTLIGGDEVIFSSLGRHAYIFQKLPEEKSSASTFSSSCEKSSLAP